MKTYSRRHRPIRRTLSDTMGLGTLLESKARKRCASVDAEVLFTSALNDKSNQAIQTKVKKTRLTLLTSKQPKRAFVVMPDVMPDDPLSFTASTPQGHPTRLAMPDLCCIPAIVPECSSSALDLDMPTAPQSAALAPANHPSPTGTPPHRVTVARPSRKSAIRLQPAGVSSDPLTDDERVPSPSPAKPRYTPKRAISRQAYGRKQGLHNQSPTVVEASSSEDSLAAYLERAVSLQDDHDHFKGRTKRRVLKGGGRSLGLQGKATIRMRIKDSPAVNSSSTSSDPLASSAVA